MNATLGSMWQWNDITSADLRQMWADGLSGTAICQSFHEKYQRSPTRCAVMGKVGRMDLPKRRHGSYPALRAARKEKTRENNEAKKLVRQPHRHLSIFDRMPQPLPDSPPLYGSLPGLLSSLRAHHCRFPVDGEGLETMFCRDQKFDRYPYCLAHCRIAYQPAKRRVAA